MMKRFRNKYRIPSARLQGYDYGSNGFYFVTICTKNRVHYFGETPMGQIAHDYWMDIPKHFPFVILDQFVVMPDHIHGILLFENPHKTDWKPNRFGKQVQNLGAVIGAYKSSVKRYANQHHITFEWQPGYHDHIIRDEQALQAIRRYIINNPVNWKK